MSKSKKKLLFFAVICMIIVIAFFIDIYFGNLKISFIDIVNIITSNSSKAVYKIFMDVRLPRVIVVVLVGIALSVSGCVLQGVTRNDLAESGVMGINAGAGLMVAICITIFQGLLGSASIVLSIVAFIGAALTAAVVFFLAYKKNQGINPNRLILTGVSITALLNAVTIIILLKMNQSQHAYIAGWLSGNLTGTSWENIKIMLPIVLVLLGFVYYKSRTLDVLKLNQISIGLGVNTNKESFMLLLAAVGLSGMCVAVGGGITFVGLICPHLARQIVGPKHKVLIPASALIGAALLLISDIISRALIYPKEISIGIVATIIGVPYFIYLLVGKRN